MGAYKVWFHIVLTSINVNYRFYGPNKYIIKIVAAIEFQLPIPEFDQCATRLCELNHSFSHSCRSLSSWFVARQIYSTSRLPNNLAANASLAASLDSFPASSVAFSAVFC